MNPMNKAWGILKNNDPPSPAPICRRCTAANHNLIRIDECGCTPEGNTDEVLGSRFAPNEYARELQRINDEDGQEWHVPCSECNTPLDDESARQAQGSGSPPLCTNCQVGE